MAVRNPLVLVNGQIHELPAGDTVNGGGAAGALGLNQHVLDANFTVTAGYGSYISRYLEIGAGLTLTVNAGGDMEIG